MKKLFRLVLLVSALQVLGQELSFTNKVTNTVVTASANPLLREDPLESKAQRLANELEENETVAKRAREILAEKRARETWEAMTDKQKVDFIGEQAIKKAFESSGLDKLLKLNKRSQELESYGLSLSAKEQNELGEALVTSFQNHGKFTNELDHQIEVLRTTEGAVQALKEIELRKMGVGNSDPFPNSSVESTKQQKAIVGSTKENVDELLKGWTCTNSVPGIPWYSYVKDVTISVGFKDNEAIVVFVLVNTNSSPIVPMSKTRYSQLGKLVGTSPKPNDIVETSEGVLSFGIRHEATELRRHAFAPPEKMASVTPETADEAKGIIGSAKSAVDVLLKDWSSRKSNRATPSRPIYYYTSDVSLIVDFKDDKAIGAYVIDRPGAGVTSVSQSRFNELVKLIGQKPKLADIKEDSSGIHEFGVGDYGD